MLPQNFREFEDGETVTGHGYDIVIHRRRLGRLEMPTGELVACDPLDALETEPFETTLEPGSYPVIVYAADLRDELLVAYAHLQVRDTQARHWDRAGVPDQEEPDVFSDNEDAGYPVDSSLGCFMDAETAKLLMDYTHAVMADDDEFRRALHGQINRNLKHGYGWANVDLQSDAKIPQADGHNIITFDSGYGPGHYETYIGRDDDGEITSIVTDFDVLDFSFTTFGF